MTLNSWEIQDRVFFTRLPGKFSRSRVFNSVFFAVCGDPHLFSYPPG